MNHGTIHLQIPVLLGSTSDTVVELDAIDPLANGSITQNVWSKPNLWMRVKNFAEESHNLEQI